MKLNPSGPNYELLKTIEEEMKNYEIKSDGTIVKITQNKGTDEGEEKEKDKESDTEIDNNIFWVSLNKVLNILFLFLVIF